MLLGLALWLFWHCILNRRSNLSLQQILEALILSGAEASYEPCVIHDAMATILAGMGVQM